MSADTVHRGSASGSATRMSEDKFTLLLPQQEMRAVQKIVSIRKEEPVQFRKRSDEFQHSFNKDLEEVLRGGRQRRASMPIA
mgnify:CR=1 FL=1